MSSTLALRARCLILVMLVAPGLACSTEPGADSTVRTAAPGVGLAAEPDRDWPSWGATPGGTHFSPAAQINPANVHELELAWTHRSGDMGEHDGGGHGGLPVTQTSLQVTPIVVGDVMYYCTPYNRVFALDAASGRELWSFDPDLQGGPFVLGNCRGVSSWQSGTEGFCEHRILTGTLDARLLALDAATGKRCPDFGDGGEVDITHRIGEHLPVEYGITSPPAILGDTVITGAMVLDNQRTDAPAGVVRAYDVRSGELRWAWNPVPPGMEALDEEGNYVSGTTNVWSVIAVDTERNLVFAPTGNTNPDFYGGHRGGETGPGLDYYSSSLVALDGDTGEIVWHYQFVHHDIWDFDTPAQPSLVELEVDGERVPAVVQVTKMGMTFALHRETGEPLWPVEERPVPQDGAEAGEYLAATQPFPTHLPHMIERPLDVNDAWGLIFLDEGICANQIATLNNQGFYTPPSVLGSVHYPGSPGGNNWGSPAIHPEQRVLVMYTVRVPFFVRLIPRDECKDGAIGQQAGTPYCIDTNYIASPLGMPCTEPPWGTLDAVDIDTGIHLWSAPLGTTRDMAPWPFWGFKGLPGIAAPMMTGSGLVFSGISNEHAFRAFDLQSGAELWHTRLPTAANALPMTYVVDGRQFVVVAAGGHWTGGSPPGDHIMAFALPGGTGQ